MRVKASFYASSDARFYIEKKLQLKNIAFGDHSLASIVYSESASTTANTSTINPRRNATEWSLSSVFLTFKFSHQSSDSKNVQKFIIHLSAQSNFLSVLFKGTSSYLLPKRHFLDYEFLTTAA